MHHFIVPVVINDATTVGTTHPEHRLGLLALAIALKNLEDPSLNWVTNTRQG